MFRTNKSSYASRVQLPAVFSLQRKACKVRHKGCIYDYFERESKKKKMVDATGLSKRTIEFVIEVEGLVLVKMTTAPMGLAVIAPVSLQIVIERNVLTEKCLSFRSVGMSKICACPRVPVEDFCHSDDQDVLG